VFIEVREVSERSEFQSCFAKTVTDFVVEGGINFNLEFFCSPYEYVTLGYIRSSYARTIQCSFLVLLALHVHHVATMSFIQFGKL
jgi:hypothetical protein